MLSTMEKIFFVPGDMVTIKHNLSNKPSMIVKNKETKIVKDGEDKSTQFTGIKCFWFTSAGAYQEQTFNTKDLQKVK